MSYFSDRSTTRDDKPKSQLKVVFPPNGSVLIICSSRSWLKGERQVSKSVAVPEVNRTAAKFNKAELARVYFFPFKSLGLLLGFFFFSLQSRDAQQKCSTIQINGHWSCIKANFLSWLIYETFYGIFSSACSLYIQHSTAAFQKQNSTESLI